MSEKTYSDRASLPKQAIGKIIEYNKGDGFKLLNVHEVFVRALRRLSSFSGQRIFDLSRVCKLTRF